MAYEVFRKIQIGPEGANARGVLIPATRKLLGTLQVTPQTTWFRPEDERNSLAMHSRQVKVLESSEVRWEGPATYDQIIHFLSMGLGTAAITTPGGGPLRRLWDFTQALTSAPNPRTYSIEYGDNTQAFKIPFAFVSTLAFTINLNEVVQMNADIMGRAAEKGAFTAVAGEPSVVEAVANKAKLWIDGTWAGLGTTLRDALISSATINITTGFTPVKYMDGRLDFSNISFQKRMMKMELDLIMGANAIVEYDAFKDGTSRAIRLEIDGPEIESGNGHRLTFDCFGKYDAAPQLFDSRDGENVIKLSLTSFDDKQAIPHDFAVQGSKSGNSALGVESL